MRILGKLSKKLSTETAYAKLSFFFLCVVFWVFLFVWFLGFFFQCSSVHTLRYIIGAALGFVLYMFFEFIFEDWQANTWKVLQPNKDTSKISVWFDKWLEIQFKN